MDWTPADNEYDAEDVIKAVLTLFPDAKLESDDDGNLVIVTGCLWTGKNGEFIMGNVQINHVLGGT